MKRNVIVSVLMGLTLVGLILGLTRSSRPDPKDLSGWMHLAGDRDLSALAAEGDPKAEFFLGLTLIRTNLIQMVSRVPLLSAIPVIGKRFFEETHYGLDNQIAPEQLAEAYRWIKRSAEQGYAPALEAEKLFIGREAVTNTPGVADLAIPVRQQ